MKRTLAIILAAIMLAAALASCAGAPITAAISPRITLTSSDGADAAEWLTARLGDKLTDRVVVGTDTDGYGVALDALEDDGYVIRNLGGEVALFARSADGLDRAVRRYAKAVEQGEAVADETYHEGARIGKITVAGADISTFAVRIEGPGRDEDVTGLRDRVEQKFADAVSPMIEKMCGTPLADEASAEHFIIFRPSADPTFTEGDFRYAVEDGDLVFEYAELLGAKHAFQTFLSDECGWLNVGAGLDLLAEADEIDIAADLDVTVDTMLDGMLLPSRTFGTEYNNDAFNSVPEYQGIYYIEYRIPHACNGWLTYAWGGYDLTPHSTPTPCMTDPHVFSAVMDSILDFIDFKIEAGGTPGYDINYVDVAHGDTQKFCQCKSCLQLYAKEGSVSGASVRFANSIWEALDEEGYGVVKVITYAYMGNFAPCKTRPLDNVLITFCAHGRCINHPLDATKCTEFTHPLFFFGQDKIAEWIKGWSELTDNLYMWDYLMEYNVHPYVIVEQIWDDMHFMSENGVTRVYWENHNCGLGAMELECQLVTWLNTHPNATKEQYRERFHTLLELHYGDGWRKVARVYELWERAELEYSGCCLGWMYAAVADVSQMNYKYYVENCWDEILTLLDEAATEANSAAALQKIEVLKACHLYHGCLGYYFPAYETDDAETMALVEDRWAQMLAIFAKYDLGEAELSTEESHVRLTESVHDIAWKTWNVIPLYLNPPKYDKTNRQMLLRQFGLWEEGDALKPAP